MTLLNESFVGSAGHPRWVTVMETPYGMLLNEEYLATRILGGEQASYDFILEIAESTLPFRNVANLLQNLASRTEWTPETVNLRAVCDQIIKACEQAFTPGKGPATMGTCYPSMKLEKALEEGKATLGYVRPDSDDVHVRSSEPDGAGRDQKYYPHTYEAILRPWMVPTLDKTIDKVADERNERARKWDRGYRKWELARCVAEERRRKRDRAEASKADEGTGG